MTQTPEGPNSPPSYGLQPEPPGGQPPYPPYPPYQPPQQPFQPPPQQQQQPFQPQQPPKRGGTGRVVGIVIGLIVLVFFIGLVGLLALGVRGNDSDQGSSASPSNATSRPSAGTSPSSGLTDGQQISTVRLKKGDCVRSKTENDVSDLDVVPCTESHDGEVTGVYQAVGGSYPGEDAITDEAERRCADFAPDNLTSTSRDDLSIYFIYPRSANWAVGDREVQCLVVGEQPLTQRLAAL